MEAWGDQVDRYKEADLSALMGKTLCAITVDRAKDIITFETTDGLWFCMMHYQDCCELVEIEDIAGDLDDLLFSPILQAEVATSDTLLGVEQKPDHDLESQTWTFYKLGTIKGRVTLRWYGTSNGYYSEEVSFVRRFPAEDFE